MWRRGVLRAWAVAAAARSGLRMMLGGSLRGAAVWPPPPGGGGQLRARCGVACVLKASFFYQFLPLDILGSCGVLMVVGPTYAYAA